MKTCTKCGTAKPLSDFPKDNRRSGMRTARTGYGVGSHCNQCRSETRKPGLEQERQQKAEKRDELARSGLKQCSKCQCAKPYADFHKRAASRDGLAYKCTACVNAATEAWRASNPDAHADWYQSNKDHKAEYWKTWREKHKENEPARVAEWAKKHPERVYAKCAKRRAAKCAAIPPWANHEAINRVYAEAARLRIATGEKYEVDHIVPLQSKRVCGLHWEGNLQILLEADNISKHNRYWPGMA